MVEFALLNIVLVPLLLYSIFLMDAAYLKLDLQETVVSGIWDFSAQNAEAGSTTTHDEIDRTQKAIRKIYSDHTSAFDDGADVDQEDGYGQLARLNSNHNHQKHHIGFGAHYTFHFTGGDTEFHCTRGFGEEHQKPADLQWSHDLGFKAYGSSRYALGDFVKCEATGYIYNYIIPETFMEQFTDVQLSGLKLRKGDSHNWQKELGPRPNPANLRAHEEAGISFNTWALRNGSKDGRLDKHKADIGLRPPFPWSPGGPPLEGNPFFERVKYTYTRNGPFAATYGSVVQHGVDFSAKAAREKLLMTPAPGLPSILGTYLTARYEPLTPGIRQRPPGTVAGWFHPGFQSTPFRNTNNNYVDAQSKRGEFYMGCRKAEGRNCNY